MNKKINSHRSIMLLIATAFIVLTGLMVFNGGTGMFLQAEALDTVMKTVIDIISKAALYIGIVIVLWGVFQIILAFRREDSEGISKQITTVVVGAVLVGFGATANMLYNALLKDNGTSK